MEIGFPITDLLKFGQAFYFASKAYYYHRFNVLTPKTYFFDALHHYYHNTTKRLSEVTVSNDTIRYTFPHDNYYYTEILHDGKSLILRANTATTTMISLEDFILLLARRFEEVEPFPPIKKFIAFPKREHFVEFTEPLFSLRYPTNFAIFVELSYNIPLLRRWLISEATDTDFKIVFVLGYDSGIRSTLIEFLSRNIVTLERYRGEFEEELLQYLLSGVISPNMKPQYGNYCISEVNFAEELTVTSTLKFINNVERVAPNDPIPYEVSNLSAREFLAQGSYGFIYETNNPNLVIKTFNGNNDAFLDELEAINLVNRHVISTTNVVKILSCDLSKKLIVMDKLNPLTMGPNPFVSQDGKIPVFLQMVQGLYALHAAGLAHNDIKPKNIMQTADGTIKLIDFGLVESFCIRRYEQVDGTPMYNPPEYYHDSIDPNDQRLMPARDIWAVALTAYEVFLGQSIYTYIQDYRLSESQCFNVIMQCLGYEAMTTTTIPKLFDLIGDDRELQTIIRSCIHIDPFQRATSLQVLQSPYAQRYLSVIPLTISPCLRQQIIDGYPFAGYRTKEQRENWIVLSSKFRVSNIETAPIFESRRLPQELNYSDYVAIILAIKNDHNPKMRYFSVPHLLPLSDGTSYNLRSHVKKYRELIIGIPRLTLFNTHRRLGEIRKIVTRGYLDGKCSTMSVLELLAE